MYWFWVDGEKYIIIPKATTKNLYKEIEQKAQEIKWDSEVSQKEKHQYSILTHIYGI